MRELQAFKLGANYLANGDCQFILWAPQVNQVSVNLSTPQLQTIAMQPIDSQPGYWQTIIKNLPAGSLYKYGIDLGDGLAERADPASYSQPEGVHGPSATVDHRFNWQDQSWSNLPLAEMIIYELHTGTFTPAGTFTAIIPRLEALKELGINTIEIMPVAQFLGARNWGYDGVFPYAVQNSYGGIAGLKTLVNACHQIGIAVILDVVYNHLGPEGNYLWGFDHYFTDRYNTPWGSAINYDGPNSGGVRHYFIANALYWLKEFHLDGLRLDAVQTIYDLGAKHFLEELQEKVTALSVTLGKPLYLIAESDLNDVRTIRPISHGGYGIDTQWADDLHHALHSLLTGEKWWHFGDFGTIQHLAKAYTNPFVYDWQYSSFRQRYHGSNPNDTNTEQGFRPSEQFIVCSQNHDQVGNRPQGDRLCHILNWEASKLIAIAYLLSPYIPMLFMGEEYAASTPFYYFVSHSDADLQKAVQEGRQREFQEVGLSANVPDPNSRETFVASCLNWQEQYTGKHQQMRAFYQKVLHLRRTIPALAQLKRQNLTVEILAADQVLQIHRYYENSQILLFLNFSDSQQNLTFPVFNGNWQKILDTADPNWGGNNINNMTAPDQLKTGEIWAIAPYNGVLYRCCID
jgi:maltooligosyltrehalose trehalohydrolase